MLDFTEKLKRFASELGFVLSGVTAAGQPARYQQFLNWLDAGYAGQMHYLEGRRSAYKSPQHVLDGCSTLLMLAYPYQNQSPENIEPGSGQVARYACGQPDYHDRLFELLSQLKRFVMEHYPQAKVRGVVDTAPLLEREMAEAAGLGWVGKNTLLLNRTWGSYFFLAALLTDLPLSIDPPSTHSYCGTCTACLQACPTAAFPAPYVLDARRCISYLTIEHRETIDPQLAEMMGNWMFGCDICQEVCPWNRRSATSPNAIPEPMDSLVPARLMEIIQLNDAEFRERFRHTPLWRSKRRGVIRNACIVLGNQQYLPALPHLKALLNDSDPIIQQSANWAVGRLKFEV